MATVKADRHTFNWPKGINVPDQDLIKIINAQVYDQNNEVIPDATIIVNRKNFDYLNPQQHNQIVLVANLNNQTASLPISIDVVDPKYADYQPNQNSQSHHLNSYQQPTNSNPQAPTKSTKKHHRWWIPALIVLAIIALIFGLNSCHQQKVNQQQNQQINQLKDQNKDLKTQIQQLKDAIDEYKRDNDEQKLQASLNQIKAELQNNNNNNADAVRKVIDQIQNDPSNAQSYLNTLYSSQNAVENIQNEITNWLAQHGLSLNNN